MKKYVIGALMVAASMVLTGCGFVDTGEVGVRTQFGEVKEEPVTEGFYSAVFSSVKFYSTKEVYVNLKDMQPKAKDNLSLSDFEVTVYYTIDGAKAPWYQSKYAGKPYEMDGVYVLGYDRVEKAAENAANDAVSRFESLSMHTKREEIQKMILESIQHQMNEAAPGVFKINRVVVNRVKTDPKVEASIIKNIEAEKRLELAIKEKEIQKETASANEKLAVSLTPEYLQHEMNMAVMECAKSSSCTLIIDGSNGGTTKNIPVVR